MSKQLIDEVKQLLVISENDWAKVQRDAWNDAGKLREYFHDRGLGQYMLFYGSPEMVKHTQKVIDRIAELTKEPKKKIEKELIADYNNSNKWND